MGRNSEGMTKMKETVGVLDKALTVISVLEKTKDGIGLTEIAQLAGINKTSCYRILNTLMSDGMVEIGERTGTYRLGIRFLELGGIVQRRINLRQAALPALTHLTEKTGDTSFLCILNSLKAVCIERIEGKDVQVLTLNVGDTWPLYIGAAPRAILANLDDEQVSQILSAPLETKALQITDPAVYWEMIRDIREKGYSVSFEDVTLGVSSIGAPVYNHMGHVVGSISLSSTIQRIPPEREEEIAQLVVDTAKQISKSLGWAP
ncbi:IclR family transcriptional regulator [Brevibacillus sp. B_LB10_24]|uniref:IclR family transcriptional regulator n=1 Tax=Brevibacillus sp. B_LB10_24 TaxID=3380645 RepID=UPI0038B8679C